MQLQQLIFEPFEIGSHFKGTLEVVGFAILLDGWDLLLESFDVVAEDNLEREDVDVWLVGASSLQVQEHFSMFRKIAVYLRLCNVQSIAQKLSPNIKLCCQVVLNRICHSTVLPVVFETVLAQVFFLLQAVESCRFADVIVVSTLVDALLKFFLSGCDDLQFEWSSFSHQLHWLLHLCIIVQHLVLHLFLQLQLWFLIGILVWKTELLFGL